MEEDTEICHQTVPLSSWHYLFGLFMLISMIEKIHCSIILTRSRLDKNEEIKNLLSVIFRLEFRILTCPKLFLNTAQYNQKESDEKIVFLFKSNSYIRDLIYILQRFSCIRSDQKTTQMICSLVLLIGKATLVMNDYAYVGLKS